MVMRGVGCGEVVEVEVDKEKERDGPGIRGEKRRERRRRCVRRDGNRSRGLRG